MASRYIRSPAGRRERLAAWLKGGVTLMAIPSGGTSMMQIVLPRLTLLIMGTALTGVLVVALTIVSHRVNYYAALKQNKELKEELVALEEEIGKVREASQTVASMQESLKRLIGLKSREAIVKQSGVGGPLLRRPRVEHAKDTAERAEQLVGAFEQIETHLEGLRSLYEATPLGEPVRGGWITSRFGERKGPWSHTDELDWHAGVDIASGTGVPIRATADGLVTYAGRLRGYGLLVVLHHGHGYSTRYGHNSKMLVKAGDQVKRGALIALMGSTGNSTGPHVHYEVRKGGQPVNPAPYMRGEW